MKDGVYYILDGHEPKATTDHLEWANWYEAASVGDMRRVVEQTQVDEHLWVSTVFLGIDHNWGDGPPLLFETMIFHDGDGREEWRYATWADAQAGHSRVVDELRDGKSEAATRMREAAGGTAA